MPLRSKPQCHPHDVQHACVANTNAAIATVFDLNTRRITDRLIAGKQPNGLAFAPLD